MGKEGQVSIEFLIITGFSLMLLIPLILLFYTQGAAIRTELVEAQAQNAAEALIESAERVYYAGPPSRETVRVYFPDFVDEIEVRNASIIIRITSPVAYDIVVPSAVPLIPKNLGTGQGTASVRVDAVVGGVLFTEI